MLLFDINMSNFDMIHSQREIKTTKSPDIETKSIKSESKNVSAKYKH